MFIGWGHLHGVEVWNNQRVLDYLVGDPDRGIEGMASPYSTVRRRSSPSTATHLFCDPPVNYSDLSFSVHFADVGEGVIEYGFESVTLDGVGVFSTSFCNGGFTYYLYEAGDAGQPRPPVPEEMDGGWTFQPVEGPMPIGVYNTSLAIPVPNYGVYGFAVGSDCGMNLIVYIDPTDSSKSAYSTDGGTTWYNSDHTFTMSIANGVGSRYTTPANDDAPWYEPSVPESDEFAGLYVEEIAGFDSLVQRTVNDGALMGSTLGPLTMKGRALTVTGWLRAGSCRGAEYGLHWLSEALGGTNSCDDCSVGDLYMLKSVPPAMSSSALDYVRVMHHVGLVDGPKVLDRSGTCCSDCGSTSLKVQFTITAEIPYIFSEVEWILHDDPFSEGPFDYDLSLPCAKSTICKQADEKVDLGCGPQLPPAPPPYKISDDCYCEPWQTMRVGTEYDNTRQWNSVTTYIEVKAGESDVRNVKIVAFHNAQNDECPLHYEVDDRWMCTTPCASIAISKIPAGGKLVIDSRTRMVTMFLAGGESIPGLRFLSTGDDSGPFDWFDIGHCTRLCMVASVEEQVSDDATISVGIVNRFLASGG